VRVGDRRTAALHPNPLPASGERESARARTLVFSHANGFPAGTYSMLFQAWQAAGWRVIALPRLGHDSRFPVSSNWPHLRDELLGFIQQQAPGERVALVGHSLGGYVSLLAASRKPAAVAAVVLLDSPVLDGWRAHSVHVMKLSGLMKRLSPGRVSARRRWQWPSREAALAHFQGKAAFARWHPRVLADYIEHGLEPDPEAGPESRAPGAVRLAFNRAIETRIYDTLPHHLGRLLQRHPVAAPVAYVAGTRSAEGRQVGLAATRRLVHERLQWIEGSHLFPMEQPEATANAVLTMLTGMVGALHPLPAKRAEAVKPLPSGPGAPPCRRP
jgi:pimeloyl-ACP methyl ester carboxylesterase